MGVQARTQGQSHKRADHRGVTLVEIILVFAIVGILASTSVLLIGHLHYADTEKAAKYINSCMDKLQVQTISKEQTPYLYIYHYDGATYARMLTDDITSFDSAKFNADGEKLANDRVAIYKDSLGGTRVDGTDFIKIAYNRSGEFDTSLTNASSIVVDGVGTYTIKLVTDTGKHFVKKS